MLSERQSLAAEYAAWRLFSPRAGAAVAAMFRDRPVSGPLHGPALDCPQLDLDGRETAGKAPEPPKSPAPAEPAARLFDAPRTMRGQIALETDTPAPLRALRHHVSGAIARGDAEPIVARETAAPAWWAR